MGGLEQGLSQDELLNQGKCLNVHKRPHDALHAGLDISLVSKPSIPLSPSSPAAVQADQEPAAARLGAQVLGQRQHGDYLAAMLIYLAQVLEVTMGVDGLLLMLQFLERLSSA